MKLDGRKNPNEVKNWIDLIPSMEGHLYNIKGRDERILHHYFEEDQIVIKTNLQLHRMHINRLAGWMEVCEPIVEERLPIVDPKDQVPAGLFNDLTNIMLDNIEKVKADPNYIPQAQTINNSVKQVTHMVKTQLDYVRLKRKMLNQGEENF